MYQYFNYQTQAGCIQVVYSEKGIVRVVLPGDTLDQAQMTGMLYEEASESYRFLEDYFSGQEPDPNKIKLDIKVSDFQWKVYQLLLATSHGTLMTYGDVAKLIGCGSPRAVGQALRKNPIPLIIPCHRVVGSGWEGGFGGVTTGKKMDFKRFLIDLEKNVQVK